MFRVTALFLALFLSACMAVPPSPAARQPSVPSAPLSVQTITLTAPNKTTLTIRAELARTERERERGLMARTELATNAGMLFIFEKTDILTFWMKNTVIPLDVIFFDANGLFVSVKTMTPCDHDQCPTYSSNDPALYALEVPAGTAMRENIGPGWSLSPPAA
jgi:uncharacterized membrane protein (UPF0127 family)